MWCLLCKTKLFAKVSNANFSFLAVKNNFSIVSTKLFICESLVFAKISNLFVPHVFTVTKM